MNMLSVSDLFDSLVLYRDIVIVGYPCSGKSYLSGVLESVLSFDSVYHCDDYLKYGGRSGVYRLLDDVCADSGIKLIEGVYGYRLLRAGLRDSRYVADCVIVCECRRSLLEYRYGVSRKYPFGFCKMLDLVWFDYEKLGGCSDVFGFDSG